tara:strand:+ start:35 stop:271 length:237 start_codon:yes stop_codon:yes gene_type:complete
MNTYIIYFFALIILVFVIFITTKTVYKNLNSQKDYNLDSTDNNNLSLTDELHKLNDLYKSGAISEEEFLKAKKKIIDS